MVKLISKILSQHKKKILAYALISVLFIWMYVAIFPSMQEKEANFSKMMSNLPEQFMEAFGISGNIFNNLEAFLASEYFTLVWPIILIVLAVSLASNAIAGEVEKGTIKFLLSQPISRTKLFIAKYISGVSVIILVCLLTNAAIPLLSLLHGIEFNLESYIFISLLSAIFGIAVFSVSLMLSSFLSTKGKVVSIIIVILVSMYIFNLIANLQESVEGLKYISFFYYYNSNAALLDTTIKDSSLYLFLGLSVLCSIIGAAAFNKRDISS